MKVAIPQDIGNSQTEESEYIGPDSFEFTKSNANTPIREIIGNIGISKIDPKTCQEWSLYFDFYTFKAPQTLEY